MSQQMINHMSTNFLNFGAESQQSRYLFWLVKILVKFLETYQNK